MRYALISIAALTVLAPFSTAHADSASARAEALFKEALSLKTAGKIAEACTALEASQSIDPNLGTLMYLADCRETNHELATAWGLFIQVEQQTRAANDDEGRQIRIGAANRAAALEPRLSRLTISVPIDHRVEGLEVRRDSTPVIVGEWNRSIPLDGGRYTIEARATGTEVWTTTIELAMEGDSKVMEVPKLKRTTSTVLTPERAATIAPSAVVAEQADESAQVEASATSATRSRAPAIAFTAGAAVLLGTALTFEVWGGSQYSQAESEPDDAKQTALWESAKSKRYIAQGLAAAGVGCGVVAVWLWLRDRNQTESVASRSRRHVSPIVSTDMTGISVGGAW